MSICKVLTQWVSDSVTEWVTRSPIELFWTAKNTVRKNTDWKNTVRKKTVWKNTIGKIQFGKIQFGKYNSEIWKLLVIAFRKYIMSRGLRRLCTGQDLLAATSPYFSATSPYSSTATSPYSFPCFSFFLSSSLLSSFLFIVVVSIRISRKFIFFAGNQTWYAYFVHFLGASWNVD